VDQQIAVQLPDVALSQRDVFGDDDPDRLTTTILAG
jgi:hypothetical protein